jgi:prophage regulatory protein
LAAGFFRHHRRIDDEGRFPMPPAQLKGEPGPRASDSPLAEPPLLRIIDVCRWLKISKPTFWRLRRSPDFPPPVHITERVIGWQRDEIQSWLETCRRSARHRRSTRR